MKRLRNIAFVTAALLQGAWSSHGHEIVSTTVDVTVSGGRLEILATMPLSVARSVVGNSTEGVSGSTGADVILAQLGAQWSVQSVDGRCALTKQAYRTLEHKQLQLRYLFDCGEAASPSLLTPVWLTKTPKDHFMIFTLAKNDLSDTVVFHQRDVTIDLSGLSAVPTSASVAR